MLELLRNFFGWICSQSPAHTWSPGGEWLPCCQRCTGLYVGAMVAAALHLVLRPAPANRWLWLNGGFLLLMVPFGFHWLPQGEVLRALTGVLFGFGLVAFLSLPFAHTGSPLPALHPANSNARGGAKIAAWLVGFLATLSLVPWLGTNGNVFAAYSLALLAAGGALVLAGLVLVNAGLAWRWLRRRCFNHNTRAPA